MGRPLIDLAGKRFGKLTVLCRAENRNPKQPYWHCMCDCGNSTTVEGGCLRDGSTKSCGCARSKPITYSINDNGCWICTSHTGRYPKLGAHSGVAKYFYEKYVGSIPTGMCLLHKCDTPRCVNPEHIFLGTRIDNNLDRDAKGRTAKGEKNGSAKLTLAQVKAIRASNKTVFELMSEYKVSKNTIYNIRNNLTWKI